MGTKAMTRFEAEKIAEAIGHIDHGCTHCVHEMCERLNKHVLDYTFEVDDADNGRYDWIKVIAVKRDYDAVQLAEDYFRIP
jgi:protein involved in temperature-dependent protein secretion